MFDYKIIITDIINKLGGIRGMSYYSKFYIGITKDITSRLFCDHNVSRQRDYYLYYHSLNEENARFVEKYFLDRGMQGGSGGGLGNGSACFVYCYLITSTTKQ